MAEGDETDSERKHDELGDSHGLDQQKRAIGPEDSQRAFDFARPVEWQKPRDRFHQPEILIRGGREQGGVPKPRGDDQHERTEQRDCLEHAAPEEGHDQHRSAAHVR